MKVRSRLALLVVLSAPLLFAGLSNHTFWFSDEPFVAEVAREMAAGGDWVVPRLNGEPFLEKPPLHYAAVAVSYRVLGVTPFAARLPSAIAGVLTILATYLLGIRLLEERTAFWGALVLATTSLFFATVHYCLVDASLVFLVTAGFLAASHAFAPDPRGWAIPCLHVAAALAFLCKGLVGPGLLVLGVGVFALVQRDWRFFARPGHVAGTALFAAIVGPWLALLWRAGGKAFYWEAFVVNSVGRFLARSDLVPRHDAPGMHVLPFYDYAVKSLPSNFLPWTPLLALAMISALGTSWKRLRARSNPLAPAPGAPTWGERFLWLSLLAGVVALSAASAKRGVYLLPLFPLAALLAAREARRLADSGAMTRVWERAVLGLQAGVVLAMGCGALAIYGYLSVHEETGIPGAGAVLLVLVIAAAQVGASLYAGAALLRRRVAPLFPVWWGQLATSVLVIAVLCAPLLDSVKGYAPFFEAAVGAERARDRTPLLFTRHEGYIGLAGLHFGRVLPFLDLPATKPFPWSSGSPIDVLTDTNGLGALRRLPETTVTLLVPPYPPGAVRQNRPCLVSCSPTPPPRAAISQDRTLDAPPEAARGLAMR